MQIVFILRDPVLRAFSAYNFHCGNEEHWLRTIGIEQNPGDKCFLDYVKRQIAKYEKLGVNADSGKLLMYLICSYVFNFDCKQQHLKSWSQVHDEIAKYIQPTLQEVNQVKKKVQFFKALEMRLEKRGALPQQKVEQGVTQPPIDMKLMARDVLGLFPDESLEEAVIKMVKGSSQRFVLGGLYALLLEPWYEAEIVHTP